jgi:hypothetical protein
MHVRPGDRAVAVRMPVVGDELAALVPDGVQVADDLDVPTVGVLMHPILLCGVESQARLAAQSHRVAVDERQAVR